MDKQDELAAVIKEACRQWSEQGTPGSVHDYVASAICSLMKFQTGKLEIIMRAIEDGTVVIEGPVVIKGSGSMKFRLTPAPSTALGGDGE